MNTLESINGRIKAAEAMGKTAVGVDIKLLQGLLTLFYLERRIANAGPSLNLRDLHSQKRETSRDIQKILYVTKSAKGDSHES